ncbi:glycosyltransferase family 22 protein [Schizophyllum amplum]|uniref:Mannosyltransferase n=1 Tax=Schizophyllum amplum TaxID=97359 RepID=A0A550CCG9_9AGAR|nr:glycosyltransferase family 22 protein [Auriculariopsis ampla]
MLFLLSFVVRILIAVLTRTAFQPDEYFQALEPAHEIVFGYGHLTWEWLAPNPIRSILYPLLNVPVYWALKATGLDSVNWLLIGAPRVVHGALAALTDVSLHRLGTRVLGRRYANVTLFLSLTSPYNALALSRSLSNSLETSLSAAAYSFYPWTRTRVALAFAALGCIVRPTNALLFDRPDLRKSVLLDASVIGTAAVALQVVADSAYYGRLVITPLNFMLANASSVSLFYGENHATYYIFQALPVLCATALPFALHGAYVSMRTDSALTRMTRVIAWTMCVYSLAGHKEWRFVHPVLPLLHLLAAKSLVDLSASAKHTKDYKQDFPVKKRFIALLAIGVPASLYVVLIHNSGPISAISYIHSLPIYSNATSVIGVLMPCHSMPGQAYLHRPDLADPRAMWSLGCEPPLGLKTGSSASYKDQTTVFFNAPHEYLTTRFPAKIDPVFPPSPNPFTAPASAGDLTQDWRHEWPRYLVLYGALLEREDVRQLLLENGYKEMWSSGEKWWQGALGPDDKRMGGIRVWRWT